MNRRWTKLGPCHNPVNDSFSNAVEDAHANGQRFPLKDQLSFVQHECFTDKPCIRFKNIFHVIGMNGFEIMLVGRALENLKRWALTISVFRQASVCRWFDR
jgi:hypothetical protein